jgi:hypothetical protein
MRDCPLPVCLNRRITSGSSRGAICCLVCGISTYQKAPAISRRGLSNKHGDASAYLMPEPVVSAGDREAGAGGATFSMVLGMLVAVCVVLLPNAAW